MFVDISKLRIYVRPGATDLRKQQAGLAVVVQNVMKGDPFSGSLYLFCNRKCVTIQLFNSQVYLKVDTRHIHFLHVYSKGV